MLCKGIKIKDTENNIYTILNCDDIHNIELEPDDEFGFTSLWCMDKNCEYYDGELICIDIKKNRIDKLTKLNLYDKL